VECPKCPSVALGVESVEGIEIDRCPSCRGIWFDCLELEKLLEADPRPLLKEDARFEVLPGAEGPRISCPRCKTYLIKLNSRIRPGTVLDSCTICHGTWVDAGELARLTRTDFLGRLRSLFTEE